MEFKVASPRSQYQTQHQPNSIFLVLLFLNSRICPTGQNVKDHQQPDISRLLPTFQREKTESSRSVWCEYGPSLSSVFYVGCNGLELSWIPKCMPWWDANQVKYLWTPFSAAHWWMSHKPGCQSNGQRSSGMASFFFLSVWLRHWEIFQTEKKEGKSLPFQCFYHSPHYLHIDLFLLPSEVGSIATRGHHEFRKNSSIL